MENRAFPLPRVKRLLHVSVSAIVEFVSNRSEAEVLMQIGDLAHEFDHLTARLVQWLEHQQYLEINLHKQKSANEVGQSLTASLAPLTHQALAVNKHGVATLQRRITECLQQLQRQMDAIQVFANQNASFSQELLICGLEERAIQRRRLAEVESKLASRLSKFLGGCDSFYDEQPLLLGTQDATVIGSEEVPPASVALKPIVTSASAPAPAIARGEHPQQHICPKVGGGKATPDHSDDPEKIGTAVTESPTSHKRPRSPPESGLGHSSIGDDVGPRKASTSRGGCCDMHEDRQHRMKLSKDKNDDGIGDSDDGLAAPSFLTPPVVGVSGADSSRSKGTVRGTAAADHAVGSVPTPLSACSSLGSTPSNESLSPAIAVSSPLPHKSAENSRRWSNTNTAATAVGGSTSGITQSSSSRNSRKRARVDSSGGGNGVEIGEATTALAAPAAAPLSQDQPRYSSNSPPTPPSTRDPSPPPLSTQDGSVSVADGEESVDQHQDVVKDDELIKHAGGNDGRVVSGGKVKYGTREDPAPEGGGYDDDHHPRRFHCQQQPQERKAAPRPERYGDGEARVVYTADHGRPATAHGGQRDLHSQEEQDDEEEEDLPDTADTVEDGVHPTALAASTAAAAPAEEAPCGASQDAADEAGGTDTEAMIGGAGASRVGRCDGFGRDL